MAALIRRYGVYWVRLDPITGREVAKTRPCVVVSMDSMNQGAEMAVVCPVTSKLHPQWKHRLQFECAGKSAEIMVDQIRAVSTVRIGKKIASLTNEDTEALRGLIARMYAMP
jgi:mRNA interferase MazF